MRLIFKRFNLPILVTLGLSSFVRAEGVQSLPSALNPKISLIGNFVGNTGPMNDPNSNKFSLDETELGFQAEVDPYARADFFASFSQDNVPSFEEGYVTLLALPWHLRARGGKYRVVFGRLNVTHPHEYSQVTTPLVLSSFLGADGLNDAGIELSRAFAPFGIFTEITYSILNGLGDQEAASPATASVKDVNGNIVNVTVNRNDPTEQRSGKSFAHVSRARLYTDFTDSSNLELGVSGLFYQPSGFRETKMGALDMTYRWKPLQRNVYQSFTWRTEAMYSDRKLPPVIDPVTGLTALAEQRLHRRGIYSYIEYQPIKRWRFGVRGDYVESPNDSNLGVTLQDGSQRTVGTPVTRAISPYITFTLTEFNRFRIEYQRKQIPGDDIEHRVFFQWTIVLGPHGAHPF